jgi:hypothetical protein
MQAYEHFMRQLIVKQGQWFYRFFAERMCGEHSLACGFELFPVIGVDREQRLAFFSLIPNFVVNMNDCMSTGSDLRAPGSQQRLLRPVRLDLCQVAASWEWTTSTYSARNLKDRHMKHRRPAPRPAAPRVTHLR